MANILSLSNTTGTPVTVPATGSPATLITYQVGENNYQAIEVNATVKMTTTGTSAVQSVLFELRSGATIIETISKTSRAVDDDYNITLVLMAKLNAKATLTVTVRSTAADAQTSVTVENVYIKGYY